MFAACPVASDLEGQLLSLQVTTYTALQDHWPIYIGPANTTLTGQHNLQDTSRLFGSCSRCPVSCGCPGRTIGMYQSCVVLRVLWHVLETCIPSELTAYEFGLGLASGNRVTQGIPWGHSVLSGSCWEVHRWPPTHPPTLQGGSMGNFPPCVLV